MPESRIFFGVHDSLSALASIPYDQPFAWVEASRAFTGLYPIDDAPRLKDDVRTLRQSILLPLEALGWYEVPEDEARYLVVALVAERTVLRANQLGRMEPGQRRPTVVPARDLLEPRPTSGNELPVGRVFRGFAILDRSGGVMYRVYNSDRHTAETKVGNDLVEMVMGRLP